MIQVLAILLPKEGLYLFILFHLIICVCKLVSSLFQPGGNVFKQ